MRQQSPLATPVNDGLMSKEYAAIIAALTPGSLTLSFFYTITQPADDDDFVVTLPVAQTGDYVVSAMLASNVPFTGIKIPYADQTGTTFRVLTDAVLDNGVIIGFTITPVI